MTIEPSDRHFPKVPIQRRIYAFAIDFVAVLIFTLPFGGAIPGVQFSQVLVFVVAWWLLRVVLVAKNQGQSLGRWALDMRAIDPKTAKTPGLLELSKREGILGFCALLATIGLYIGFGNGVSLILLTAPLAADCGAALTDENQQALHDRLARSLVVASRRGFSLDLRVKKLLAEVTRRVK